MGKATLVIMAAGIGSRFGGGIKQLEPIGPNGEIMMDYSIYDAVEAGFDKVVFVIRKDLDKEFKSVIGHRIEKIVDVDYVYQELSEIPEKHIGKINGRKKPWGTGQAILCCKDKVDTPFLVINADDYYGKEAYVNCYKYLTESHNDPNEICMVGFVLKNTLSDNGGVTRGICKVDEDSMLTHIVETKNIEKMPDGMAIINGSAPLSMDWESPVSMNMWGLHPGFFQMLEEGFDEFLTKSGEDNSSEFLLPEIIGTLLKDRKISVKVLESNDKWFGVTYKEDKDAVVNAISDLIKKGCYPEKLY